MLKRLIVFLFCSLCFSVFAQQEYLSCIRSGEYAYFLDYRYETTYARGYLVTHYDKDTSYIFSSTLDMDSGKRWNFYFITKLDDEGRINIDSITGLGNIEEDKKAFVFQTVIDFLNYAEMRKSSSGSITENCVLEDPWSDDFSLWYHFSTAVPFFGFTKITSEKNAEKSLIETYCFGLLLSLEDEDLNSFFKREIVPYKETSAGSGALPKKAKKMTVNLNDYKVSLDENWQKNSFEGNDCYWLSGQTDRDAQIMVELFSEKIPSASKEDKLAFIRLVNSAQKDIIPTSIKARFEKNDLVVEYYNYQENGRLTYSRMRIKDDCIINFSSFKDIYEKNTEYFEKILKSVKK